MAVEAKEWRPMSDEELLQRANHNGVGRVEDFCRIGLARTGVDAIAVTYRNETSGLEVMIATDDFAERIAQLEVTVGEGPTMDVVATGLPAAADDLRGSIPAHRWPVFASEAVPAGVGAVHVYPIVLGGTTFGAVGLYSKSATRLTSDQHRVAEEVTELIGLALLDPQSGESFGSTLRMTVHQAAGMVMVQMGISIRDALVLLRSTAFAEDSRVTDLAADVIAGRRRFEAQEEVDD